MNVVEGKVLGFPVSADEVDGPVGVLDSLHEGFLISNVDGNEENLAQVSGDFETVDFIWVAAVGDDHLERRRGLSKERESEKTEKEKKKRRKRK